MGGITVDSAVLAQWRAGAAAGDQEAIVQIAAAAKEGNGDAAHLLAVLTALGIGVPLDLKSSVQHLQQAAEQGQRQAQAALAALVGNWRLARDVSSGKASRPETWGRLSAAVDTAAWLRVPDGSMFSAEPRIAVVKQFISAPVCDWLIELGRPHLQQADVYDSETGALVLDARRSNSAAQLEIARCDVLLGFVRARIASLTNLPPVALETSQILHYEVGQEFRPHYDFLNVKHPALAGDVARNGQRAMTVLIYLNDDYDGGDTAFLVLGRSFKGRRGDALIFWNVTEDGELDWRTQHAGTAPTRGEKWLFSQWIRVRMA